MIFCVLHKKCYRPFIGGFISLVFLVVIIIWVFIPTVKSGVEWVANRIDLASANTITTNPSSSSGTSINILNNTTWHYEGEITHIPLPDPILPGRYSMQPFRMPSQTIYFGNGNYRWENETGTYAISGDTVTLTSTSDNVNNGTIIGNSLRIGNNTFYKIQ